MPIPSARKPIPRVFISSTFEDLRTHREAVFEAIHGLGAYSDDMVYWSADERSGAEHSVERVAQSDVLILILAHRYGYVPPGGELSVTHMEFRAALAGDVPVLAFFLDENEPWPVVYVEAEKKEALRAFKREVEQKVTRKLFKRAPEDLGRLVTQAMAQFIERYRESLAAAGRFAGTPLRVDPPRSLTTAPDAVVHIGNAEDGLPLLLEVVRTRDLSPHLDALAGLVSVGSKTPPTALISTFRQALQEHAHDAWAHERLVDVRLHDGSVRRHYVSAATLATLFQSTLAALLGGYAARVEGRPARARRPLGTIASTVRVFEATAPAGQPLQSAGGANRFLAIEPGSGTLRSVGLDSGQWVEWRPFRFESLRHHYPGAHVEIDAGEQRACAIEDLPRNLYEVAVRQADDAGRLPGDVNVLVARQAVGETIAAIARAVAAGHAHGFVHGDLKPTNVLLCAEGPQLIDAFDLQPGALSPGWTPNWSAPEQVLGEPVQLASDVYPLAMMVVQLLGGRLVGEVRKFRTPPVPHERDEDVFYNPAVFIDEGSEVASAHGQLAWRAFVAACLRFDPAQRPATAAEFETRLRALLSEFPLAGEIPISFAGGLRVATLPDGSQAVARTVRDGAGPPGPPMPMA